MRLVPVTHSQANQFVEAIHRHNGSLPGSILRVGIVDDEGLLRGVAIAGLPKARMSARPGTLEVNRVCTDGIQNGCSMLYGAIRRAAKALGYQRLITYTVEAEDGASLKASGWTWVAETKPDTWTRHKNNPGYGEHDEGAKNRWQIVLTEDFPEVRLPEILASDQMELVA
jgi:hypothetical protein